MLRGYILASSIGMALYARTGIGEGQEVHVATMEFNMIEHLWGGLLGGPWLRMGYSQMFTLPIPDAGWLYLGWQ